MFLFTVTLLLLPPNRLVQCNRIFNKMNIWREKCINQNVKYYILY